MIEKLGSQKAIPSTFHIYELQCEESITGNLVQLSPHLPSIHYDILVYIFSFLCPVDLSKCLQLNKTISVVALDAELWQTHCVGSNIPCGPGIESLWERCDGHRGRWWKEIYMEWSTAKRNWRIGFHKKRMLRLADCDDAISVFKYDIDKIIVGTKNHELKMYVTHETDVWNKPGLEHTVSFTEGHSSSIMCIDFISHSGSVLVTGDANGIIVFWNVFTGAILGSEKGHNKGVSCIIMLNDHQVLTCGFDRTVKLFELDNSRSPSTKDPIKRKNFLEKILPRSRRNSKKRNIKLRIEMKGHNGDIYCMVLLENLDFLATGSIDQNIKVFIYFSSLKRYGELKQGSVLKH